MGIDGASVAFAYKPSFRRGYGAEQKTDQRKEQDRNMAAKRIHQQHTASEQYVKAKCTCREYRKVRGKNQGGKVQPQSRVFLPNQPFSPPYTQVRAR